MKLQAQQIQIGDSIYIVPSRDRGYTAAQVRDLAGWSTVTRVEVERGTVSIGTTMWAILALATDTLQVERRAIA